MAHGLPVEGEDGPFLGDDVIEVPTCEVTGTVADARHVLQERGAEVVVVVHAGGLAVGEVDDEALDGQADDAVLLDVLRPVPTTVRPSVTAASLLESGGGERLVTTPDGRLLGAAAVEAADDHHDHHHHDHHHDHGGEPGPDLEAFERELTEVIESAQERFGEREPSEEQLRAFLRDRLVAEGRTPEEADRFLGEMGGEPPA